MKRFSKILTLILALVIIVTAFTVVALAEDAAEPKAVNVGGFRLETHFDHEYWTIGKVWGTSSGSVGDGEIKVNEAYPGGNKFLHITGTATSTTTLRYQTFFGGVFLNQLHKLFSFSFRLFLGFFNSLCVLPEFIGPVLLCCFHL